MDKQIATQDFKLHLAEAGDTVTALVCREPVELASVQKDGKPVAPEWIQVFPKGPEITGLDGRRHKLSDPADLVAKLNARNKPVLIDFDHRSAFPADKGGSDKAAGWMVAFEDRGGEIWAKVDWTVEGAEKVANKEYRFYSPAYTAANKEGSEIVDLIAGGLVNLPAFEMAALASKKQTTPEDTQGKTMDKIIEKLGLEKGASEDTILAALDKRDEEHKTQLAKAESAAVTPSTDKFMPRADYDAVLARAEKAEEKLAEVQEAEFKQEAEALIAGAIKDKKIAPSSKDHYLALCTDKDALAQVAKAIGASPVTLTGSGITGKPDEKEEVLTAGEKKTAANLGISEEDYLKSKEDLDARQED